ncbi:MAG: hypothetical protein GY948_19175 [Alphaproteobacteria bacterium]|nr:hypothetical protein [Alphaproteobacteria bacterium]
MTKFQVRARTAFVGCALMVGAGAVLTTYSTLVAPPATAATDAKLSSKNVEQINKVSGFFNGFKTLTGQFVQVGPRGNISNGTFYISKPGKMRFEYNPPSPYLIVSDGTWVVIMNRKNKRTDHYPLSSTPLQLVLSKNVDLMKQARILGVKTEDGSIKLTLAAKNKAVPGKLTLTYSEERSEIQEWAVIDGEGRRTTISLSEMSSGGNHAASLFKVKRPKKQRERGENR